MLSRLRHWSQHMSARLPALLPCSCALCGSSGEAVICVGCHTQFFGRSNHRCTQCALPLADSGTAPARCGECLARPPSFDATIVAADYVAPIDQLVLALKFGSRLALAPLSTAQGTSERSVRMTPASCPAGSATLRVNLTDGRLSL